MIDRDQVLAPGGLANGRLAPDLVRRAALAVWRGDQAHLLFATLERVGDGRQDGPPCLGRVFKEIKLGEQQVGAAAAHRVRPAWHRTVLGAVAVKDLRALEQGFAAALALLDIIIDHQSERLCPGLALVKRVQRLPFRWSGRHPLGAGAGQTIFRRLTLAFEVLAALPGLQGNLEAAAVVEVAKLVFQQQRSGIGCRIGVLPAVVIFAQLPIKRERPDVIKVHLPQRIFTGGLCRGGNHGGQLLHIPGRDLAGISLRMQLVQRLAALCGFSCHQPILKICLMRAAFSSSVRD